MKNFVLLWTIVLGSSLVSCQNKNVIQLTMNGQTSYEIVIANNADSKIDQAAKEIQTYIAQISEVSIPIVTEGNLRANANQIILEQQDLSSPEQIRILTEGQNLIIAGGNPEAVYNSAMVFLEDYLGCRWYSPKVEKIPQQAKLKLEIPINYSYTPEITTRTVHSRLFYKNHDFAYKHRVTTEAFPKYVPSARVHTFHRFMPETAFYEKHPEYYALRGKRRLPTQLCLTNNEVLRIVTDSVKAYFERHPEAAVISVSQDDNTQYCECEHCKKIDTEEGSPSATMVKFVNEIAKEFPKKMISTLAYQHTRKPCKTKPADNVLITLCSIECDRSAPIEEKCSDFASDLIAWKQLTENIRIWDYTTQFTNFLAPFPNLQTLQANIQFFRNNNAKWIFEQHSHNPSELFELRSYLMAKLLWNPDVDVESIITDFTNGYYEEAGVFVKKYIDQVHQELANNPDFFLYLYGDPSQAFESFLKPELLVQYNTYFDEAEQVVVEKPEVLERVKTARLSVNYASLEAARKNSYDQFSITDHSNGELVINEATRSRLKTFKETCEKGNILLMNEMGYKVTEYCDAFEVTIDRLKSKNIALNTEVKLISKPKKYANENPQTLTDGSLGGSSFFANWLGFEGNDLEAVIDLGKAQEIKHASTGFLQVSNHIVFFPKQVTYWGSTDNKNFKKLGVAINPRPIHKKSKVNDIEFFNIDFKPTTTRYLKIKAQNVSKAPVWHNAAGLPVWIFCDEVMVN